MGMEVHQRVPLYLLLNPIVILTCLSNPPKFAYQLYRKRKKGGITTALKGCSLWRYT